MPAKAPRNKTIRLTKAETGRLAAKAVKLKKKAALEEIVNHIIWQDAFKALDFLPDACVDLMIVDPPYNLTKNFGGSVFKEMKDDQYYSKIALKYCKKHNTRMITRGNLDIMEDLLDLFDPKARYRLEEQSRYKGDVLMAKYITKKAQFVLNKLDRESKRPNAIFRKGYICYNGIINRPTRCFEIKE